MMLDNNNAVAIENPEVFTHPFTCVIAGQSGSGKSFFVRELLEHTREFTHVQLFIGTSIDQNQQFQKLVDESDKLPFSLSVCDVDDKYGLDSLNESSFQSDVLALCNESFAQGNKLCLIFDDLMTELGNCKLLSNLFSKTSSHTQTSVIMITQNLFHQGKERTNSDVFRNAKIFVLFAVPSDHSVFDSLARKLRVPSLFFKEVIEKHRYIVFRAGTDVPPEARFLTDLFSSVQIGDDIVPTQTALTPVSAKKSK